LTSLTPYSESLERVRSVLVFFAATGPANAAVLAELESEVRLATFAGRQMALSVDEIRADLQRLASVTLVESSATAASRMMTAWAATAYQRSAPRPAGADEVRRLG
jgi:hypothetical protein